jgi:hypothetical protein
VLRLRSPPVTGNPWTLLLTGDSLEQKRIVNPRSAHLAPPKQKKAPRKRG